MMKKALFAATLVLGVSTPALAQTTTTIPVRVQQGDAYTVSMDITQTTAAENTQIAIGVDAAMVFEVLEPGARGQGGVWRWTYEGVTINSFDLPQELGSGEEVAEVMAILSSPAMDDILSSTLRLFTDLGVECRVDATGGCVEITNWHEWRERAENVLLIAAAGTELAGQFRGPGSQEFVVREGPGFPPKNRGDEGPAAAPMTSADAMLLIAPRLIREIGGDILDGMDGRTLSFAMAMPTLTGVQGRAMRMGEAIPIVDSYAMPFGAPAVTNTGTITLRSIDRGAGVARVSRNMTLDEESLRTALVSMSETLAPQILARVSAALPEDQRASLEQTPPEMITGLVAMGLSQFTFALTEETDAQIDLSTGLVREATSTFRFTFGTPDGTDLSSSDTVLRLTVTPGAPHRPRLGADALPR